MIKKKTISLLKKDGTGAQLKKINGKNAYHSNLEN